MKTLKYIGLILAVFILLFGLFIGYSMLTFYNPPQELTLAENNKPDTMHCDSTYQIISWNIGYAGLGENMDFFYDGGKRVRDTRERVLTNFDSIQLFLKRNSKRDFILLQEVDQKSKRSHSVNELESLGKLGFHTAFAMNYVVSFVPVPPTAPMGQVKSGILSLSQNLPGKSVRYGYPGMFDWPTRLFNLRRCMLVNRYPTNTGKEFVLINTHMSAFDDGSLKKQEMQYLKDFIVSEFNRGNFVVVGGDWNQLPPEFPRDRFGENYQSDSFILSNIASDFMPSGWKWAFDPSAPTNRYLNESYVPGKTFCCLIDHFLVSPNIGVIQNQTINLNFQNSDHNPILMKFRLNR
jgi:endonuclease/exonuclease/phosphatase family metal-dependent hydrolase